MLDTNLLFNHFEWVAKKLARKNFVLNFDELNQYNDLRKILQKKIEKLQIDRKNLSKTIILAKSQQINLQSLQKQARLLNQKLILIKSEIRTLKSKIKQYQLSIPNIPDDEIPNGFKDQDNIEIMRWGKVHKYDFKLLDHITLGKLIGGIDLSSASKITGTRFIILKGEIAYLHRALSQFMIDIHIQNHGYIEYYLPYLINVESLYGSGQLPKFYDDLFHTQSVVSVNSSKCSTYTLIPTAEVPLVNIMRSVTVHKNELPIKMVAHTPCFRLEAGTYGYRAHGLIRTHQFDKVELVQVVHPDQSVQALEEITNHAEKILQLLELPYRKMLLCAGNISFTSCKTYDLEVWLPARNEYCEISSCSNIRDFQSRRINARFKDGINKRSKLLHTLNASGVAVGRALVAILENYQLENGCIKIPEVLSPYMNGMTHIHYQNK
ncbi:seryl-tRNA synthetase [Candidatus Blochmanniella floridana]|uniref:Serine--tRNA ligase n=1 Tax=Blochmanniella floridana TaxID=203907 RepID=SYS_BLOFL|nr:RecName: Full=Serine--tRNA ligase; AltName: Full=Seryl-tRNA synthetase; Short=SerRS; AltName: Full=Seryl-tRNA(Ser/Sec) synthetase [Candidatus Blochmannia floridanus]CAD83450.1 seryl-tRNA synthetase [Candidatus Blochmannia floridanus]